MNRISEVLLEQGRSQAWLARMMEKSPNTINNWCLNKTQPNIQVLFMVANLLGVESTDLIAKANEE